jgi:hypothetical protein
MAELSSPDSMDNRRDWRTLYYLTVLETDWSKMEDHVREIEAAITHRLEALSSDRGGTLQERLGEQKAIAETQQKLILLRRDVARWRESKGAN